MELVDYNVVVPHFVSELFWSGRLEEEQLQKIMTVSELLMIKDCSVFLEGSKLDSIVRLVRAKADKNPEVLA